MTTPETILTLLWAPILGVAGWTIVEDLIR